MQNLTKEQFTKILITLCIIVVGICIIGGVTTTADIRNKAVDATYNECEKEFDILQNNLSNPNTEISTLISSYVEICLLQEAPLNKQGLTYFDGSTNKYDECNEQINKLKKEYENYFEQSFPRVFHDGAFNFDACTKSELLKIHDGLKELIDNIVSTQNSTQWTENSAWTNIWGISIEKAKENYGKFLDKAREYDNHVLALLSNM